MTSAIGTGTVSSTMPVAVGPSVAVAAAERGTAILVFERSAGDRLDVTSIERLSAGLDPAVRWLTDRYPDLRLAGASVIVDADGLGQALWTRLAIRHRRGWQLFDKRGRDRQELVNGLLVAQSEGRIAIGPTEHAEALRKALLSYNRTVTDDGVIGAELVVALALVAIARRPVRPRIY